MSEKDAERITHIITGLSQGGAEGALYKLIAADSDPLRHSVVSLTDGGAYAKRLRALGVSVECLNMNRVLPSPCPLLRLIDLLAKSRPSVIQTWMYHADLLGGIAAKISRIPVCWGIRQGNITIAVNSLRTWCIIKINGIISHFIPDIIVSCSRRAAEAHRSSLYKNRFAVIPNGIDLEQFARRSPQRCASLRRSLGIPSDALVVGHLGRADPQKDHRLLLEAFMTVAKANHRAFLVLAGRGLTRESPYLCRLLGEGAECDRVVALGPRDDVVDLLSIMDVFALSSVGEAFPNVVIEAMSCGVPCIVTDVGDAAEIVGNTGWVCRPRDVSGFVDALFVALNELHHIRIKRGEKARQRVIENYSITRMFKAYNNIWKMTIKGDNICAV